MVVLIPKKKIGQGDSLKMDHFKNPISNKDLKAAILVYSGVEGIALVDEISEFFGEDPDQFILKLGLFYFTAIGQGGEYHHGFYGPLPVPSTEDHVSFVFTTTVSDPTQLDLRSEGKSYVLTCLTCRRSRIPKCMDRFAIETAFEDLFAAITDVNEIDPSFSNRLKLSLINGSG